MIKSVFLFVLLLGAAELGDARRIWGYTEREWMQWVRGAFTINEWAEHCSYESTWTTNEWDTWFRGRGSYTDEEWKEWWLNDENWV